MDTNRESSDNISDRYAGIADDLDVHRMVSLPVPEDMLFLAGGLKMT